MVKRICGVIAFLILSIVLVSCKKSKYEVVFRDYTGAILKTETVVDGNAATAPANPVREGYNFTGWDVSFDNVTGNIDVKAEYTIKKYEVKFYVDGEQHGEAQQVEHGKNAVLPANPTKAGYTFTGWEGDFTHVTKAANVSAVFDQNVYKVTFKDHNGYIIKETHVPYGEDAVPPTDNPVREGYTFTGWTETVTNIKHDLTVLANYEVKKYTVKFFVDGNLVAGSIQEVKHGENAVLPDEPVKEGYTFTGWVGGFTHVTKAADVNAAFDKNVYKVTFKDHNGYIIKEEHVEHGSNATAPTAPDNKVGYHFKQWLGSANNITKNTEIVADYEINKYTVKFFVDNNLVVGSTQEVNHGENAVLPDDPIKEGYTFTGWLGNYTNVIATANITAAFDKNVYKVTFKDYNGYIVKEEYVEHGQSATAPSPNREGYTFDGWTKAYNNVTADVVTEAEYTRKQYTVRFLLDGNPIEGATKQVYHGEDAVLPADPVKDGYTFKGWLGDNTRVVNNIDIIAVMEKNYYRVIFVDWNETIIKEQYVEYGQNATEPAVDPEREGFDFLGWVGTFTNITADTEVEANYGIKNYQITYDANGGNPVAGGLKAHGTTYGLPKPSRDGHTFIHWKVGDNYYEAGENYTVLGAVTFVAQWALEQDYTMSFEPNGGNAVASQLIRRYDYVTELPTPVRENWTFVGWSKDGEMLEAPFRFTYNENIELLAIWNRTIDGVTYLDEKVTDGIAISKCSSTATNIILPDTIESEKVVRIASYAFNNNRYLKNIKVGANVEKVGYRAFANMINLENIEFNNNTKIFSEAVFAGCIGLKSIKLSSEIANQLRYYFGTSSIPETLVTVEYATGGTFIDKTLTQNSMKNAQLKLASDTTEISSKQFESSKLTKIFIPNSVTKIGERAFFASFSLTDVIFENGSALQAIENNAFNQCFYLSNITLAENNQLNYIEVGAFYNCHALKTMTINKNVTQIGEAVFGACRTLESLTIPFVGLSRDSVGDLSKFTHIFYTAQFSGGYEVGGKYVPNTLTKVEITDATKIQPSAFLNVNKLQEVTINKGVTEMGLEAFKGCYELTKLSLPFIGKNTDPTAPINESRFGHIFGITEYAEGHTYKADVYYIPNSLATVEITGATVIRNSAFQGCKLITNIDILDDTVTSIGDHAFYECTALQSFNIPVNIQKIGNSAFRGCEGLITVAIPQTIQHMLDFAFADCINLGTVEFDITSPIEEIGASAFSGCPMLEDILNFPNAVKTIGASAFENCISLWNFTYSSNTQLTTIGASAFKNCKFIGDPSLELPKTVKTIGASAFENCTMLEEVSFAPGATLLTIGDAAFKNTPLVKITLPTTTETIGASAFENCTALANISIPQSVTQIQTSAFENCQALAYVNLASNNLLSIIGPSAFKNCISLTTLSRTGNITEIGLGAFSGCKNLQSIILPFVGKSAMATSNEGRFGYIFGSQEYEGSYYADGYQIPETLVTVNITPTANIKIDTSAFKNCVGIKHICIGSSGTTIFTQEIGLGALEGCNGLESIMLPFTGKNKAATGTDARFGYIFGKTSYLESYGADGYFIPNKLKYVEISSGETIHIEPSAFLDCYKIEKLWLTSSNIKYIGSGALKGCYGLKELALAFVGRTSLTNPMEPKENKFGYIFGETAYQNSYNADGFFIPNNLRYVILFENAPFVIAEEAFKGCSQLTHVEISDAVTSVGTNVFEGCVNANIFLYDTAPLDPLIWADGWNSYRQVYYRGEWENDPVTGLPTPVPPTP